MRAYDTIVWSEEVQNNGLAGVTGTSGLTGYTVSGDTIVLKDLDNPFLCGFGSLADTKGQGCEIIPSNGNNGKGYFGPGGCDFAGKGFLKHLRNDPIPLFQGDTLTGYASNTNVNEGILLAADVCYGGPPQPWDVRLLRGVPFQEQCTITSAAAVTFNSGAVSLDSALTNTTNWFDPLGEYYITGVSGCLSAATFGGVVHVTNLPDPYQGRIPGLLVNPLSAVTFSPDQDYTPAMQPIGPFSGAALPQVGLLSTSAGALKFTMHLKRTK